METTLAVVIVGLAVVAIVRLVAATNQQTGYSQKLTTAFMLANHTREMMTTMDFTTLQTRNSLTYSPPIDANGQPITALANWQQTISVQLVGDNTGASLYGVVNNQQAIVARVRVTISYRPVSTAAWSPIVSLSWLRGRY